MEVRFLIDLDTGLPHVDQHNVTPTEVLEFFTVANRTFPDAMARGSLKVRPPADGRCV
jgi:hypothetical protein